MVGPTLKSWCLVGIISLLAAMITPAWAQPSAADLAAEFERLRLMGFAHAEKSQTAIDELFASLDLKTQPRAYLAGYILASEDIKSRQKAPPFPEMLIQAKALQDPVLIAHLYLGEERKVRDKDHDQTFHYLDEAAAIAQAAGNDLLLGEILTEKAYVHYIYYNRQESIKTIEAALELMKDHPDDTSYMVGRSTLASILYSTNRQEEAARISGELVEQFKTLGFHAWAAVGASNTATFYEDMDPPQLDKARALFEVSLAEARLSGDRFAMATAFSGVGRLNAKTEPAKAIENLTKGVALYHELDNRVYETDSALLLADVYIQQGDAKQAHQVLESVAKIAQESGFHDEKMLHLRSRVAELNRDYKKAFELFQTYHNTREARKRSEEEAELNRLSTSMNLRLEEEKNKNLQIDLARQRELLFGSLVFAALIVAGMLWSLWQGLQIRRQKRLLQEVLDSVHEGILRFGMDKKLIPPYSRHLEKILGHNRLIGASIDSILFPHDPAQAQQLHACLDAFLGENQLSWDLNAVQLPDTLPYEGRILQLYWYPMQHNGITHGLMLVLRDISEQKAFEAILESERAQQAKRNQQTLELQWGDMGRSQRFLKRLQEWLEGQPEQTETRPGLLRRLHTWKGEARTLGLKQLALCLHRSEQTIMLDEVRGSLKEYLGILAENQEARDHGRRRDLLSVCGDLFTEAHGRAQEAGLRWGALEVHDGLDAWNDAAGDVVREILVHAIANSLDHGFLRSPPSFQKTARVHLTLKTWEKQGYLHLQLVDNGQGIAWDRVQELARARGLTSTRKEDMIQVLFEDGTSTAATVSLSSGRGVGLAAIRSICADHGGRVVLKDGAAGGTCLELELPLPIA